MTHNKAIVISKWWAGIFAALATTSAISAFGFAWNANSQQAIVQEKVRAIEEARLPDRMARIEKGVENIEKAQTDMSRNIEYLVRQQIKESNPVR